MSSKKKAANGSTPPEVPIFLQKTYCMIDTCPPQIATWSSDGLTFLIKNTHLFETTIIPQYFKHSKFSSFVRQLNFYGFRKIRLDNSLKIDLEKEREQRNFWRFRHENFRRGRKDLLREIKRHASSSSSNNNTVANAAAAAVSPNAVMSNNSSSHTANSPSNNTSGTTGAASNTSPQEVTRLNTEVNVLKEQMQSMVTKMEDLTDLVKTMKVSPPPMEQQVVVGEEGVSAGNKRKKTNEGMMMALPESVPSSMNMMMMGDNDIKMDNDVDVNILPFPNDTNMMSLEDAATTLLPDLTLSSNPSSIGPSSLVPTPVLSRCSSLGVVAPTATTTATAAGVDGVGGEEEDFVEELFHAFATGDDVDTTPLQQPQLVQQQQEEVVEEQHPNKPDRQLMKRIEDSLSTIPKTMQEMVANRLIDAIAEGTASISEGEGGVATASAAVVGSPSSTSSSVPSPNKENTLQRSSSSSSIIPEGTTATAEAEKTSIPLPLAIATLKTILADYGLKVEENNCGSSSEDAMVHRRLSNKSLPLVPMHA